MAKEKRSDWPMEGGGDGPKGGSGHRPKAEGSGPPKAEGFDPSRAEGFDPSKAEGFDTRRAEGPRRSKGGDPGWPPRESPGPRSQGGGRGVSRPEDHFAASLLLSVLAHLLFLVILLMAAFLVHEEKVAVPVFEIVSLDKPKIRPLRPKVKPPETPEPPPPEPARPEEAPRLTPEPKAAPKKPEPKTVKENPDTTVKKVTETPPREEEQVLTPTLSGASDPRLSLWARRVQKQVELLWNPPTGIGNLEKVQATLSFTVSRDGTVSGIALRQSSGFPVADDYALRTLERLQRTPPIPPNFPEEEIHVTYNFFYPAEG